MADRYKKPCFDSSVFLGGLNEEIKDGIKRGVVFRYLWDKAKEGEFPLLISALAIAETFKKRNRPYPEKAVLDEFLAHINQPFVEVIEIDRETALQAHSLCRTYAAEKLMPNDALHLACAIRAGCDVLLAWDGPLVTIKHNGIRIETPQMYDKQIFTESEFATPEEIRAYEEKIAGQKPKPIAAHVQGGGGGHSKGEATAESTTAAEATEAPGKIKEEPKSSIDPGSPAKA